MVPPCIGRFPMISSKFDVFSKFVERYRYSVWHGVFGTFRNEGQVSVTLRQDEAFQPSKFHLFLLKRWCVVSNLRIFTFVRGIQKDFVIHTLEK